MIKSLDKTGKKRRLVFVISIMTCLIILVSIAGGTFIFDYGIVRKAPMPYDFSAASTNAARLMAQGRIDGKAWMDTTPKERLTITARDGIKLVGYYFPATRPSKKVVVLIHGHRSRAAMMGNYAKFYRAQGFNVFMADNRSHGESDGKYVGMGWLDRLDYLQWLKLLVKKAGTDSQIVLHGISMGASTAMMVSGEVSLPKQVKCIIADCGFTSVYDEYRHHLKNLRGLPSFPILPVASLESKLFAGYSFSEASSLEQVKKTSTPIFFIHGGADNYNPVWMVYKLYDAAAGEKKLWVVKGVKHGVTYYKNPDQYNQKVREFYESYLN